MPTGAIIGATGSAIAVCAYGCKSTCLHIVNVCIKDLQKNVMRHQVQMNERGHLLSWGKPDSPFAGGSCIAVCSVALAILSSPSSNSYSGCCTCSKCCRMLNLRTHHGLTELLSLFNIRMSHNMFDFRFCHSGTNRYTEKMQ